jgi:large exoprotein involved in heme utilization and adhesion
VVDVQSLVDRDVCGNPGNSFYITGRGGLPPHPDEPLSSDTVWIDDRAAARGSVSFVELWSVSFVEPMRFRPTSSGEISTINPEKVIEATGWNIAPHGQIILTANQPFMPKKQDWRSAPNCQF